MPGEGHGEARRTKHSTQKETPQRFTTWRGLTICGGLPFPVAGRVILPRLTGRGKGLPLAGNQALPLLSVGVCVVTPLALTTAATSGGMMGAGVTGELVA